MNFAKLLRLVLQNAKRHRREFILSGFGIVIGVAAFVFFLGLSMGVRNKVLEIYPMDQVEVVAPQMSIAGKDLTKSMGDETIAAIVSQEKVGVKSVVPRMNIDFPVAVSGWLNGDKLSLEFVGDGVEPEFLHEDGISEMFRDWEADDTKLEACQLPKNSCNGLYYCDKRDMKCHHRVPVVVSSALIDMYNLKYATSRGLPVIGKMEQFIVQRGGLSKMRLYLDLGQGAFSVGSKSLLANPRRVEGVLLGISDRASQLAASIPMAYVRRWNKEFAGEDSAASYSSLIVTLKDTEDVAPFGSWLESELKLQIKDSEGERIASVITIITLIFIAIVLVIGVISAVNIGHSFFMQVSERRREIGLLRSIGATEGNIQMLFVGEAALLGFLSGVLGVLLGLGIGALGDWAFAKYTADFALKPKTLFDFQTWILLSGVGIAVLFGVVGGALPARKAARMQPAEALTQ